MSRAIRLTLFVEQGVWGFMAVDTMHKRGCIACNDDMHKGELKKGAEQGSKLAARQDRTETHITWLPSTGERRVKRAPLHLYQNSRPIRMQVYSADRRARGFAACAKLCV
jgi:hypothetical protein